VRFVPNSRRLIFICEHVVDTNSAQGSRIIKLVNGFLELGCHVCIFEKQWDGWYEIHLTSEGNLDKYAELDNLSGFERVHVGLPLFIPVWSLLRLVISPFAKDSTIYISSTSPSFILLCFLAKWNGVKLLTDIGEWQGTDYDVPIYSPFKRFKIKYKIWRFLAIALSDFCVAITSRIASEIESRRGRAIVVPGLLAEKEIINLKSVNFGQRVLPHKKVNLSDSEELDSFLYAGTMKGSDGIDLLFKALINLYCRGYRFKMYTCGPFSKRELKEFLRSYDIEIELSHFNWIHLGFLSSEHYRSIISRVSLVVIPRPAHIESNHYSFPTRVLDTIGSGGSFATATVGDIPKYFTPMIDYVDLVGGSVSEIESSLGAFLSKAAFFDSKSVAPKCRVSRLDAFSATSCASRLLML